MNVSSVQINLDKMSITDKTAKEIRKHRPEIRQKNRDADFLKKATLEAEKLSGEQRKVIEANIDSASVNPEVLSSVKFHGFHTAEDYEKSGKRVGEKISIYDISSGKN